MKNYLLGTGLTLLVFLFVPALGRAQNDHYPQFMDMGNRAYGSEKYDLARDYYQSALDDNSDCWQAYVGLGNCDYVKGKFKEALKNYETALKMNPDNPTLAQFLQALRYKMYKMGIYPTPTPTPVMAAPPPGLPGAVLPLPGTFPPK